MPKHWNCFVAGCKSNHSTKIKSLKYFRIPKSLTKKYDAFFKTDCVKWDTAFICSLHWTKGRKNAKDFPDIRIPDIWRDKSRTGMSSIKKKRSLPSERSAKRVTGYNKLREKIADLQEQKTTLIQQYDKAKEEISELKGKVDSLTEENLVLKTSNVLTKKENKELKSNLSIVSERKEQAETLLKELRDAESAVTWESISDKRFKYLTGLSKHEFRTLFDCFDPFLHLLSYEGCKFSDNDRRKLSKEDELFSCLTICRHALHLGVMAWIVEISESTMSRIFEAWMVFGSAVFSKIDLTHPKDLIKEMMPKAYKNLDYSHIVLVLDATEFKTTGFSDLVMNQLFFSDYKNTHTVKALACLTPHGTAAKVPDIYPGSITDSLLTESVGALDNVLCHDGVLTDKGFAISEQLARKGGIQNRPPMKFGNQFTAGECDANFKIACLRIHVERWIGYLRDYSILNAVWPSSRVDLLNCVWVFLSHITNLLYKVGPKE